MTKQTHFYLRDRKGHPIGVVAMRKEDDGVRVAASLCATTDEWDKHVGVAKAVGRLESKRQSTTVGADVTLGEVLDRYFPLTMRINAIDFDRATQVFNSQYERLTTPRPA